MQEGKTTLLSFYPWLSAMLSHHSPRRCIRQHFPSHSQGWTSIPTLIHKKSSPVLDQSINLSTNWKLLLQKLRLDSDWSHLKGPEGGGAGPSLLLFLHLFLLHHLMPLTVLGGGKREGTKKEQGQSHLTSTALIWGSYLFGDGHQLSPWSFDIKLIMIVF